MKNRLYIVCLCVLLFSCSSKKEKEVEIDKRTELFVEEPIKSILDSLIAIETDSNLIQEICVQTYDASSYRIAVISRSYSLDKEYGKPLNYFVSNRKKIDVYTGLERFFQPADSISLKKENRGASYKKVTKYKENIAYRIVEFRVGVNKNELIDLKIWAVPAYIPFLEISSSFKEEEP